MEKVSLVHVLSSLFNKKKSFLSRSSADFSASFSIYLLLVLTAWTAHIKKAAKFGAKTQRLLYLVNIMTRHLEQG